METLTLIKKSKGVTWWEIDITKLPIQKVLEIIVSEIGDDYQVKRAPARVVDECLQNIKSRAVKEATE